MNSSFTEDESMDSGGEDYDPEEYKLQDIAAIVLGSGDVKQVRINRVTSDNENDSFEQIYNSCTVNETPEIDSCSTKINHSDASENNQELVNGNDEGLENPPSVGNLNKFDEIDPSLDSLNVETNFTPVATCSSATTSPSRITSCNIADTLESSSLSPIRREKSPENCEVIESTAESIDPNTTDPECVLKVLDEVKASPNSSESYSELPTHLEIPLPDDESIEQNKPLGGDNYNTFCDRENLEKISQCDKSNDEERTPRGGSKTPILCSPASQDFGTENKDDTFESAADLWKEDETETREETTQNGCFESANELWKEDEENLNSSFSNIDIPLPPSDNRVNEKDSKRWKISKWSTSKRDQDRDRLETKRDRGRRDRRDSSRDGRFSKRSHHRDSSDEKHSKDSRSRKSDSDRSSRKRRSPRRRSKHRSPDDYKRDDHRRSESSRWSRKERSRDRSSTYDRHRSSKNDRRDDRYSKDKRYRNDRYSSGDTGEKSSSRKHDDSKSRTSYKSSRKHSYSSDASSDDSRTRKTNDSDRRSKHSDRRSQRYDRRSKDYDRRRKGSERRHNDSDRKSPDFDQRHNDSDRKSPDFDQRHNDSDRKSPNFDRRHNDSDRRHNDTDRKTPDFDRRLDDFDRKSQEFDRRRDDSDRRSKDYDRRRDDSDRRSKDRRRDDSDRKSQDFDTRQNDSGRRSKDFDRRPGESDRTQDYERRLDESRKSYESERQWQDDRFELNKDIDMPNPFAEENWDEEALTESYYCDKRPPEPKSPPPPEPDYPPPEPNYPPPESDYPPEPDYSPDDRPPSPPEEPITSPPRFEPILENEYRTERCVSKDAERMICDCVLTKEEIVRGEKGCGEDCLNRLLLIECCSRCTLGERCSNKSFQRREYPNCEIFKTKKKGHGLRTLQDIPCGTFIMEYVGEVLDSYEFEQRAMNYARGKSPHFYFMSLKSDSIIDATVKGNISRFINHSCEPNCETQKWTVQGELRIGFFSLRDIKAGEEVTFDYQLQRYGKQAQRCYCEAPSCSGWIGDDPEKYVNDDRHGFKDWETALDEISQVGLMNRHQTLNLNRLMVHAKELPVRMQILQLIEEGNPPCRRLFVDYHGLPIIWSWMVDCTPEQDELKIQILKTLASLPITNKTILVDSKILSVVEQWAFMFEQKVHSSEALSAQSVLESVEDIASADETPVSELAQKLMNDWSSLREAYRIPRKERIQQMKKHEQEADQTMPKHRPKRLPVYAEQMRDRYRRNRHSRDKDFEKIYFDRMKDYNGAPSDQRKRRESPTRNFENRKQRRGDHNKEGGNNNKVSKSERRFMFEMKVKREEKEQQQQQQQWLKLYYTQQQSQLAGMMLPAPYMTHLPPPQAYPPPTPIDPKQQPQQQQPSSTRTHPYYPIAPPVAYPGVPTTHIQLPSSTPQATSALPPHTQYYRATIAASPYPTPTVIPYPRPLVADQQQPQPVPPLAKSEEQFIYDYQAIRNQIPQMATVDEATLRETLRRVETLTERRESISYPSSSVAQPANETDSAEIKLPPNWKTARDNEGRVYYYHTKTRVSQWYPPTEASRSDEDTSDGRSTGEDDDDVEFKKRRRKSSQASDKESYDMDAELKENLAAMSSEFQDSDYEDYSPVLKNNGEPEELDKEKSAPQAENTTGSEKIPLITEHIISPREPIDKEERIRNKKRIRSLKEKVRKQKKAKLVNGNSNGSKGSSNGHVSSNSSKLVSAPADTSSITERKKKDAFRTHMANFVVSCLNPYFHASCTKGRITNDKDFKHLARKLTHFVMLKELKHCQSVTDLTCNSSVKHKAKEFIRKYMWKFGDVYVRPPDDANY